MTGSDPGEKKPEHGEISDRTANIFLLVAAAAFIGAGVWLVDAMLAARKVDECLSAGRRNCGPAEAVQR